MALRVWESLLICFIIVATIKTGKWIFYQLVDVRNKLERLADNEENWNANQGNCKIDFAFVKILFTRNTQRSWPALLLLKLLLLGSISSTCLCALFPPIFRHQKISNPKHRFVIFGAKISEQNVDEIDTWG